MKKEKFILPTFMTVNYSENKIFEGFNFKSFIRNKQSEANPICSICLANCNGLGSEDFAHTARPNLILLLNAPTLPIK